MKIPLPYTPENRQRYKSWLNQKATLPASWAASAHRAMRGRHTKLIAVTGSFGKTTATRAIAAMLGQPTDLEHVPNCFGRLYMQAIRQTNRKAIGVVEVGIGRPNQMRGYASAMRPDIAVVTSIGWEHEKYFPDGLEGIRNEKAELVRALPADGAAVLNRDDVHVMWMATQTNARIVTFGRHPDADVRLVGTEASREGSRIRLSLEGSEHVIETALLGSVAALPLCAAIAAVYAAGADTRRAIASLAGLSPTLRRLELVHLPNDVAAIIDDYKGTPPTAHAAFDCAAALPASRRIAVLGNIPKLTPPPKEAVYRKLGEHAGRVFDRVFLIHLANEAFEPYRQALIDAGLPAARISRVEDIREAAVLLRSELEPGDVLLMKGHFTDHLSRIAMLLQGVGVECRLRACTVRASHWCDRCSHVMRNLA